VGGCRARAEGAARLVIVRFGVVLAPDGGALGKMRLPFKLGVGGPIGSGKQWMSWVDREDVLRLIEWAIDTESARGIYNATAPEPVRNRDFARALGRALHRPAFMPAPAFALRLALGQMADEALLGGQRVLPSRARRGGLHVSYPTLDGALRHAGQFRAVLAHQTSVPRRQHVPLRSSRTKAGRRSFSGCDSSDRGLGHQLELRHQIALLPASAEARRSSSSRCSAICSSSSSHGAIWLLHGAAEEICSVRP
jgi:hypothetical protein